MWGEIEREEFQWLSCETLQHSERKSNQQRWLTRKTGNEWHPRSPEVEQAYPGGESIKMTTVDDTSIGWRERTDHWIQ